MRKWIHVLDVPCCYERAARVERKSALQAKGSGLVSIVGPCAQRRSRVALMPQAIARASLSRTIGMKVPRISRGLLSRRGLFFVIPVNSLVATFEQSENVAIAHLVGARVAACCEGCGLCNNRYRFKVHSAACVRY